MRTDSDLIVEQVDGGFQVVRMTRNLGGERVVDRRFDEIHATEQQARQWIHRFLTECAMAYYGSSEVLAEAENWAAALS